MQVQNFLTILQGIILFAFCVAVCIFVGCSDDRDGSVGGTGEHAELPGGGRDAEPRPPRHATAVSV